MIYCNSADKSFPKIVTTKSCCIAELSFAATLIVACPTLTPVTTPVLSTVAISSFKLDHTNSVLVLSRLI